MDEQDWVELMEEPPGGDNHGRAKSADGGWTPLETAGVDPASYKHFVDEPRRHGTRYMYQRIRCRCAECRGWNVTDLRRRRGRSDATPSDERPRP